MKRTITIVSMVLVTVTSVAQKEGSIIVNGSIQSDMMVAPLQDNSIGTAEYDNNSFLTNTYLDLQMQSKYIDAGGRFEFVQLPMPGFHDPDKGIDFKGWGIPNLYVKAKLNNVSITAGSFYEQFGSGLVLRLYEERSLGIDNSLAGGHILWSPVNGVTIKALTGAQRNYWKWNKSLISGIDAEIAVGELFPSFLKNGANLNIGFSWVNRCQDPKDGNTTIIKTIQDDDKIITQTYCLDLPRFTNAFDARVSFQNKGFSLLAEYAAKTPDPNSMNSYIYGRGHAELLSMTYTTRGLSALLQARRSENMAFRSDRGGAVTSPSSYINHLPAYTIDQTYALAALYPYTTQTEGEWAYQGSVSYKISGRYKPKYKINYSLVTGLEHARENISNLDARGTDGARSSFFKHGDVYFQDLNLIYEQKFNPLFELHLMYAYQYYNKTIIRGEGGTINSHIGIAEGKWKVGKRNFLRAEAQYLHTPHKSGDWGFGLVEFSLAQKLMLSVSDQIGRPEPLAGSSEYGNVTHYYHASATYNFKSHRLQMGFGRTRAGYNCSGGVCRYVPASKGLTISYNYNF